jgi:hypothetical protein
MKDLIKILLGLVFVVLLPAAGFGADTLNSHPVKLDSQGKLISWVQPQEQAYDRVMRLAWDFMLGTVPVEPNGLRTYFSYCCMNLESMHGTAWPHNPAGVYAMLVDSATTYYAYSGDRRVLQMVEGLLDYQLAHGTTPSNWSWASVPYASSDHGATEYRGAHDIRYHCQRPGCGDGYGVIEPDKLGELGLGYLKWYMLSAQNRFRDAAMACANALAAHIRPGDATHSPWPFRVYAEADIVREEYSSNVIGAIRLFDALMRLNLGDVPAYRKARQVAWMWLMEYPMKNNAWSGYFEDVYSFDKPENLNQYSAMETARFLMEFPESDVAWRSHVPTLIDWVERTFIYVDVPKEPGVQWGANAVSEQNVDMNKMGSHTSRYASINACWFELTGDKAAKEKAFRSFNWASYMCRENGFVNVGPIDQSLWFSDGYGDYIRHFMAGLGSIPEWAPSAESHVLRSSSVVTSVSYLPGEVDYQTFDEESTEVLRLNFVPRQVLADGKPLLAHKDLQEPGWEFEETLRVMRVHHARSHTIRILETP